jgi:MraZ protein
VAKSGKKWLDLESGMFSGEHYTILDDKGRIGVPTRLRELFPACFGDERLVITKCMVDLGEGEVCRGLAIYPLVEWRQLQEKVEKGGNGLTASQLNSIRRLVLAPGVESAPDKQGRVLVPPTLRNYAAMERDVVFVGMQRKIEVWSQEAWDKVCRQAEKDFPADTQAMADLGL